jgi:amino acid transporter
VNFATALFFVECLNVFENADGVGIAENFQTYQTYLIFVLITLICHAIPAFGNRWLTLIEYFAIFWTLIGVSAIIITILVVAQNGRRSADWVFTSFEPQSGWPDGWSFCIGLLQAAYGLSATGMVTSMCEEVRKPATEVPRAIVGGVAINALAGAAFLIPVAFVLPDIPMLANIASGQPVPTIVKSAVGNSAGAFCLLIPLIVLGLICGLGCVTATSRATWAFARDGAIPGSRWWKSVNERFEIPMNSLLLGMAVELLLGLIYFGSSAAFNAFSGVGVIFLTLSYACPVAVSLILRGRRDIQRGSFNLGSLGCFCNIVCICWCLLAIPLFSMPTSIPVTTNSMNYASVVFVGFVSISGVWYGVWGRKNYIGPALEQLDGESDLSNEETAKEEETKDMNNNLGLQ